MAKITIPYAVSDFVEMRERAFIMLIRQGTFQVLRIIKLLYSYVLAVLGRAC